MSNVIRFPRTAAGIPATPIPREQFERLAGLALDVVDQIVALLEAADSDADLTPPQTCIFTRFIRRAI